MRLIKDRIIYVFIAVALFFMLLGGVAVYLIDQKIERFNSQTLKKVSEEKYLLVSKEIDAVSQSLYFLTTHAEEGQLPHLHRLINHNQHYDFLSGYVFRGIDGKITSYIKPEDSVYKEGLSKAMAQEYIKDNYFSVGDQTFVVLRYSLRTGYLDYYLSLNRLNTRFWSEKLGSYAYSEVYDKNGIYIIGPEPDKIGKAFPAILHQQKKDTIIQSDYLKLDVLQQAFDFGSDGHTFKILISVPLLLLQDDITEVAYLILGLWVIGIVTVLLFLFLVIKQSGKQYALQMKNLGYQNDKSMAELSNLKQKLNPHFLFNTLGTLQQLIGKDTDLAKRFVTKLAKVYRKLLHSPETGISALKDEIYFVEEYLFLQHLRFGESLKPVIWEIDEAYLQVKLPTLSLQILVENAIKHNEVSLLNPLSITIATSSKGLLVRNNKCLRRGNVDSEGYGTKILEKTYAYYMVTGYKVVETDEVYEVYLPYLP